MAEPKIKADMSMGDILAKYPETAEVFQKHGLHCLGCAIASFETLEQGALAHGMDIDKLLEDLNKVAEKKKK
jgi:hybrid cluster-associated redox disulfide protein